MPVEIAPNEYKYEPRATFVRFPRFDGGSWHIWGPDTIVVPGTVVNVYAFGSNGTKPVEILEVVGYRSVKRRNNLPPIRYVMCTFDNVAQERVELTSEDVWSDAGTKELREQVREVWPSLARALDIEAGILEATRWA